jgi:serine/threonine-protein kinase
LSFHEIEMSELGQLGNYRILERIGSGSMGEVFRAEDTGAGRQVALKVMFQSLSEDAELVERFRREAHAASLLVHPNITRVYESGQANGRLFMAMELLDGADLRGIIRADPPVPLEQKLQIMLDTCGGMAYVHALDMVHRDIKPGNIHIKSDWTVKIMDFGLVRLGDSVMTQAGSVMGSPSYMAPEIVRGEQADARTDVFSLGAVFYELLTGQRPFPGKQMHQVLMLVLSAEPKPLRELAPEVPAGVAEVVTKCLSKGRDERYTDAGPLRIALALAGGR